MPQTRPKGHRLKIELPRDDVWQELRTDLVPGVQPDNETYAAAMGPRRILLPIRALPMPERVPERAPTGERGEGERPEDERGVASLILNQASFEVLDAITGLLAGKLRMMNPDMIVAVPTLGLPLAEGLARRLGHRRMVPLGISRKFWYDEDLSEPVSSITSSSDKTLWLDPRMGRLLTGRVVVVDDVISTGTSLRAVLALLQKVGVQPAAIACAMVQGDGHAHLSRDTGIPILSGFSTPILHRRDGRWV